MTDPLDRFADWLGDPNPEKDPTRWVWLLVAFSVFYVGGHLVVALVSGRLG